MEWRGSTVVRTDVKMSHVQSKVEDVYVWRGRGEFIIMFITLPYRAAIQLEELPSKPMMLWSSSVV